MSSARDPRRARHLALAAALIGARANPPLPSSPLESQVIATPPKSCALPAPRIIVGLHGKRRTTTVRKFLTVAHAEKQLSGSAILAAAGSWSTTIALRPITR